jgi:hypothetical protein
MPFRTSLPLALGLLLLVGLAEAKPPVGLRTQRADLSIRYYLGDKIERLVELPPNHHLVVAFGPGASIGYMHWVFEIGGFTFWTWGGEYVIYQGDRIVLLGHDAEMVQILTEVPAQRLRRPWYANVPTGWLLIAGLIALGILTSMIGAYRSDEHWVSRKLEHPDYREAVRLAMRERTLEGASAAAERYLIEHGVPAKRARRHVRRIMRVCFVGEPGPPPSEGPRPPPVPVPDPSPV